MSTYEEVRKATDRISAGLSKLSNVQSEEEFNEAFTELEQAYMDAKDVLPHAEQSLEDLRKIRAICDRI